jgi:bifunctional DNA-binding transcriptional regulator/antitoxin component of YhaV-PrlF toxin-antitoxin module
MSETTEKVEKKGRIMIPKNIRKAAKIKAGTYVHQGNRHNHNH